MTVKTAPKQKHSGQFRAGQSGNPNGRPVGSRNSITLAIEALLDGEAEAVTRKAIEAAKGGDMVAIRIIMDRICPPRRSRPVKIDLPNLSDAKAILKAQEVILQAVGRGDLLIEEAEALSGLIEARRKAFETQELELRLQAIEGRLK
jgi:Family of unknown function (DUF5681)